MVLTIRDDLGDICDILKDLKMEIIRRLGVALGLHYPKLSDMKSTEEMVEAWLNREYNVLSKSGTPTWSTLASALDAIGQTGIAEDVREKESSLSIVSHEASIKYQVSRKRKGEDLMEAFDGVKKVKFVGESSREQNQFTGKRKRERIDESESNIEAKKKKLEEHIEESGSQSNRDHHHAMVHVNSMKRRFADLQDSVWSAIDNQRELSSCLVEMNVVSNDQVKDTCIYLAQRNWTCIDYERLEHIAESKCGATEQQMMREYNKEMQKFCERRVSELPSVTFSNEICHSGVKKLYVTLDLSKSDPSLKQIINDLKFSIAQIFGFSTSKLVLYEIGNGGIVTFLVLSSANFEPSSHRLSTQQEETLKSHHVVSVKYESRYIFDVKGRKSDIQGPSQSLPLLDNVIGTDESGAYQSQFSFPSLDLKSLDDDKKEELQQKLFSDSVEITYKFQHLFVETTKSLEQRGISAKLLYRHLQGLGSLKPTYTDVGLPVLRLKLPQIQESSTARAMSIVQNYCSFFDYDLIKHIIDQLGTETDKINLSKYEKSFEEYAQRHIFECPSNVGIENDGDAKVFVKLDESHDMSSLSALRLFVKNIKEVLHLHPTSGLKLCRIESGCLKLTFQLPYSVLKDTFPLSTEQETSLCNLGVNNLWLVYQFNRRQQEMQSLSLNVSDENSEDEAYTSPESSPQGGSDGEEVTAAVGEKDKAPSTHSRDSGKATSIYTSEPDDMYSKAGDHVDEPNRPLLRYSDEFQVHNASRRGNLDEIKKLVDEEHLDPLQEDETGNTALHCAAAGGHLNVLQYFIEELECAPSSSGQQGCTPLHTAAEHGHIDVVDYLVDKQVQDPQFKDEEGLNSLHKACQGGNLEVVQYLVEKMKENHMQLRDIINDKTEKGNIPLHYASLHGHLNIVKYLISKLQCNPNTQGWLGYTALHCAAEKGDLGITKYLIEEERCDPSHCTGGNKMTPLHIATKSGQLNIVKYLSQEQSCNLMCKNSDGDTPLNIAAFNGHLEIVDFFISVMNCDPNTPGAKTKTPMHNAAQGGHLHIIRHLIEVQKCDPSRCFGEEDVTPLHDAARAGELKIVKYLTQEKKCNPLSKRLDGETPLNEATYGGHLDIVDFFISELKCDPNTPGEKGRISLHLAVQQGHMHIVKYLVENQKCDPSYKKGEDQVTPLHVAAYFGRLDMAKYLTQGGRCDPLSKNAKGETALNDAALKGGVEVVKYFISGMKCDPNSKGERGRVPLHLAAQGGHMDLVKYLVEECHCDKEPLDDDHMTPLHLAAMFGHLDVVKYLIFDKHCNPTIQDSYPLTPLHYAAREGHIDVVKYFVTTCKCPLNVKGYRNYTPLKIAEIRRHTHVVNYLKTFTSE